MSKNLLKKIMNDEDLWAALYNSGALWFLAYAADVVSNAVFHFNLNKYNSIGHLVIGTGLGTLVYKKVQKKTGSKLKGMGAGLLAGAAFSVGWEYTEYHGNIFATRETQMDTISDFFAVGAGNVLGPLIEGLKSYINKKKD